MTGNAITLTSYTVTTIATTGDEVFLNITNGATATTAIVDVFVVGILANDSQF